MKENYLGSRIWRCVIFSILVITILRGVRFPNLWSYSHFLFNYDHGFIKRGFIGSIIGQLNIQFLHSYDFFFIFSLSIFIINIILLILFIKALINNESPLFLGVSLVFVSSLSIVFLSHTMGYSDQIGLLLALLSISIKGFYKKIFFLLLSMPIALLIHESILIIFYPVIFMSLLFEIQDFTESKKKLVLISFSVLLVVFVFIIVDHTLVESEANEMYFELESKTGQSLRQDAFNVLVRDSEKNIQIMEQLWLNSKRFPGFFQSFFVTGFSSFFFIYLTAMLLRKAKAKFYLIMLSILASLSPLLMHFWGWDMHRWNTLTVTTSFLMLFIVYSKNKNNSPAFPAYIYPVMIFLIFLNGIISIPLFDGYTVKDFPFAEHLNYILDVIGGREAFPSIPIF